MGKPLSTNLRFRLVAAASAGMSRRRAAERFGVSATTAVRCVAAVNTTGTVAAKPKGGNTRSRRMEAFSSVILRPLKRRRFELRSAEEVRVVKVPLPDRFFWVDRQPAAASKSSTVLWCRSHVGPRGRAMSRAVTAWRWRSNA